jgi:hypothetical protein
MLTPKNLRSTTRSGRCRACPKWPAECRTCLGSHPRRCPKDVQNRASMPGSALRPTSNTKAKTSARTRTTPIRASARKVRSTRKSLVEGGWHAESGLTGTTNGLFMG